MFGLFWKRTTGTAALWTAIASVPFSIAVDLIFPSMPFLDQMGLVFILLSLLIVGISMTARKTESPKAIKFQAKVFHTEPIFNALAMGIILILAALYAIFW